MNLMTCNNKWKTPQLPFVLADCEMSCIMPRKPNRETKQQKINPVYFKQWLDIIDSDIIIKIEKLLSSFEIDCATKDKEKSLKKCVLSINKLDEKYHFIMTIEAENVYDKLVELSKQHGLDEDKSIEIVERNRDW